MKLRAIYHETAVLEIDTQALEIEAIYAYTSFHGYTPDR